MYPAGFTLLSQSSIEAAEEVTISSNAVTIGDLMELDVGAVAWTDADASTEHWQLKGVAIETVTTAATVIKLQMVTPGQIWVAETANNSAAVDNGDRMLLSDANTVNNTGTDNTSEEACFIQLRPIGAAAEKRVAGIIVFGTGVNPDAA